LGDSATLTAATQNVSGSHASLLAPQRVVLAATATGLLGREGDITRAALPPVLISVAILSLVGLVVR
jgi:lactate permease